MNHYLGYGFLKDDAMAKEFWKLTEKSLEIFSPYEMLSRSFLTNFAKNNKIYTISFAEAESSPYEFVTQFCLRDYNYSSKGIYYIIFFHATLQMFQFIRGFNYVFGSLVKIKSIGQNRKISVQNAEKIPTKSAEKLFKDFPAMFGIHAGSCYNDVGKSVLFYIVSCMIRLFDSGDAVYNGVFPNEKIEKLLSNYKEVLYALVDTSNAQHLTTHNLCEKLISVDDIYTVLNPAYINLFRELPYVSRQSKIFSIANAIRKEKEMS